MRNFNAENLVEKTKNILISKKNGNFFNIAFSSDKNYSRHLGVTISSLLTNNSKHLIHIHLFVSDIDNEDINKLSNLPYTNVNITIYWLNDSFFKSLPINGHFSIGIYYRLAIPHILYKKTEKVLYLDIDTLIVSDIANIFDYQLKTSIIAAIPDTIDNTYLKTLYPLGFSQGCLYFNSGVMLINPDNWIKFNITEKFMSKILLHDFKYPDQDVLNLILINQVLFIPEEYNWQRWWELNRETPFLPQKNIRIIHFIGPLKPWQEAGCHPIYYKYYCNSLWHNVPLEKPTSIQGYKKASKSCWKNKKRLKAIKYQFIYICKKIKYMYK